jgi:hypothetical protein
MIIDVDHMSMKRFMTHLPSLASMDRTHPVITGQYRVLAVAALAARQNENAKTDLELDYIKASNGLVGADLLQDTVSDVKHRLPENLGR